LPLTLIPVPFDILGYHLDSSAVSTPLEFDGDTRKKGVDLGTNNPDYSDPKIYKSFSELDHHIEKIIFILGENEIVRLANKWKIEPSNVNINLAAEAILVNNFRSDLYDF